MKSMILRYKGTGFLSSKIHYQIYYFAANILTLLTNNVFGI